MTATPLMISVLSSDTKFVPWVAFLALSVLTRLESYKLLPVIRDKQQYLE